MSSHMTSGVCRCSVQFLCPVIWLPFLGKCKNFLSLVIKVLALMFAPHRWFKIHHSSHNLLQIKSCCTLLESNNNVFHMSWKVLDCLNKFTNPENDVLYEKFAELKIFFIYLQVADILMNAKLPSSNFV